MAGLIALDTDLEVVQRVAAVIRGADQVDPGAVGAAGSPGGLAVHGYCPQPGQYLRLLGGAPGAVARSRSPTAARRGPGRR